MRESRYWVRSFVLGVVAVAAASWPQASTAANSATDPAPAGSAVAMSLPWKSCCMATVWDPSERVAYLFGGQWGPAWDIHFLDEILRFDPAEGTVEVMDSKLPNGRSQLSAVWDPTTSASCPGGCAYVFGGRGSAGLLRDIVRYSPGLDGTRDGVAIMSSRLTSPRDNTRAVWDGHRAFIIGGDEDYSDDYDGNGGWGADTGTKSQLILEYEPATDELSLAGTLPTGLEGVGAAWDPRATADCPQGCAYVLGGRASGPLPMTAEILRFRSGEPIGTVQITQARLPGGGIRDGGALWDGRFAYLIGGCCRDGHWRNEIVRLDPVNLTIEGGWTYLPWTPTTGLAGMGAIWDGSHAFLFGGVTLTSPGYSNSILRHDLSRHSPGEQDLRGVLPVDVRLSASRSNAGSVWDGRVRPEAGCAGGCFYVFGGDSELGPLTSIDRFNPATRVLTPMKARLPRGVHGMAAVWDDRSDHAYLFGGWDWNGEFSNLIVRYDPSRDVAASSSEPALAVADTGTRLTSGRCCSSAVWDGRELPWCPGGCAYLFGGYDLESGHLDEIVRFNPASGTLTRMKARLPGGRCCSAAVWDGVTGMAYILGGWNSSEILAYNPLLDVPADSLLPSVALINLSKTSIGGETGVRLPAGDWGDSAVWDGRYVYLLGSPDAAGGTASQNFHHFVRFDPRSALDCLLEKAPTCPTGTVKVIDSPLPTALGRVGASDVCVDGRAYLLGGGYRFTDHEHGPHYRDDIARYVLPAPVDELGGALTALLNVGATAGATMETLLNRCNAMLTALTDLSYRLYDITDGSRRLVDEMPGASESFALDVPCEDARTYMIEAAGNSPSGQRVVQSNQVVVSSLLLRALPDEEGRVALAWDPSRCGVAWQISTVTYRVTELTTGASFSVGRDAGALGGGGVLWVSPCGRALYRVEAIGADGSTLALSNTVETAAATC